MSMTEQTPSLPIQGAWTQDEGCQQIPLWSAVLTGEGLSCGGTWKKRGLPRKLLPGSAGWHFPRTPVISTGIKTDQISHTIV